MGSQRFCLRWNNHQSNLLSVFDQLLHDGAFVDVTLAVEGQFLKAHKMVLSACSPYFQALFVGHPDKHPIVILKDVPFADMRSLLDFMYRGEVSVDQDRLTAFLKVAESLRIKGLTEVNEERCDLPSIANSLLNQSLPPPPPPNLHRISQHHIQPQHYPQQPAQQTVQQPPQSCQNNKRLASQTYQLPNAMLNSALTAPKRKRGRPRKLSGSNPGTPNPHASDDQDDVRINNIDNHLEASEGKNGPTNHCSSPRESGGSGGEESNPVPGHPTTDGRTGRDQQDASPSSPLDSSDSKPEVKVEPMTNRTGGVADPDEAMDASDAEHETDDYNCVKTERDGSKPSTSGQDNVPAYQGPNSDGMERFVDPKIEILEDNCETDEESQNFDFTGCYEDMISCSPASSDAEEEYKPPSKYSSKITAEAENMDEDISQFEQDSLATLLNQRKGPTSPNSGGGSVEPSTTKPPTSSSTKQKRPIDKVSIRRYCTREDNHIYRCNFCAKTYTHISNFCRHFLSAHYGIKQDIHCPVCFKPFTRKDNMMTHAKQVHGVAVHKGFVASAESNCDLSGEFF